MDTCQELGCPAYWSARNASLLASHAKGSKQSDHALRLRTMPMVYRISRRKRANRRASECSCLGCRQRLRYGRLCSLAGRFHGSGAIGLLPLVAAPCDYNVATKGGRLTLLQPSPGASVPGRRRRRAPRPTAEPPAAQALLCSRTMAWPRKSRSVPADHAAAASRVEGLDQNRI
jgi:hypothetical protein